ncbi:solute carrier family 22 member 7 [Rhipicephalus sanguineus]|uniref:Uncharacterized protein n=1 Tax=Rhipicephalus sanguineus TaxID=34632 RepID=A0A9D4PVY0_RHISA|nr:solute carrier family 22 member 7 [Rhipicephalus sanguineus]KAH7956799.1 hypothetical protein HPB52_012793 [Rhipicephalus sanguineus]
MLTNDPAPEEATVQRQQNSYSAAQGESGDENIPLGDGSFQKRVLIITVFTGAVYYAQILLFWMTWREMDHWCRRPSGFANMSVAAWKELAIPRFANGSYSHCTVRVPPHGGNWARVEPCVEWEFDMDEHGNTAVSQWSVVCERRRLADVAQGAHMAAMIVAFFVLGPIADHIGRKTVGVLALAASLITLAATSVATDLQTFIVVRSVAAAATAGLFVFKVLLYEITTMTRRLLYTAFGTTLSFVFPHLLLTIAITLKVSWTVCHSLLALFALVLLAAFHVLDESPSWLLAAHREDEAKRVALSVANINQAPISDCQEFFKKRMYRAQHLPDGTTGTIQASHVKRQDLRLTYALTVFIWTVLGFTHVHFSISSPTARNTYVRALIDAGIVPVLLAVWPRLENGRRVRNVAANSALVFSASSALFFSLYTANDTALSTVLLVVMRLAFLLVKFLEFYLTLAAFPTESRCTGSSVGLAFYVIGTATGLVTFLRVLKSREDSALAAETMLMAATAVAIVYVPSADVFLLTSIDSVTPVSLPSKQSPVDSAQPPCSSAVPVVAEAETKASPADVRLAARKKAKAKQMPEQYAVRASGLPMNW